MKYNELILSSHKKPKRVGRGIAAGQGKTAGRGTKGQKSRTGSSRKPGFEGGQNPLIKRIPKLRGFTSKRVPFEVVYTGQINLITDSVIDNNSLSKANLVTNPNTNVKLIIKGDINKKLTVQLQAASLAAIKSIEKAGGSFTKVDRIARQTKKSAHEK